MFALMGVPVTFAAMLGRGARTWTESTGGSVWEEPDTAAGRGSPIRSLGRVGLQTSV